MVFCAGKFGNSFGLCSNQFWYFCEKGLYVMDIYFEAGNIYSNIKRFKLHQFIIQWSFIIFLNQWWFQKHKKWGKLAYKSLESFIVLFHNKWSSIFYRLESSWRVLNAGKKSANWEQRFNIKRWLISMKLKNGIVDKFWNGVSC